MGVTIRVFQTGSCSSGTAALSCDVIPSIALVLGQRRSLEGGVVAEGGGYIKRKKPIGVFYFRDLKCQYHEIILTCVVNLQNNRVQFQTSGQPCSPVCPLV